MKKTFLLGRRQGENGSGSKIVFIGNGMMDIVRRQGWSSANVSLSSPVSNQQSPALEGPLPTSSEVNENSFLCHQRFAMSLWSYFSCFHSFRSQFLVYIVENLEECYSDAYARATRYIVNLINAHNQSIFGSKREAEKFMHKENVFLRR